MSAEESDGARTRDRHRVASVETLSEEGSRAIVDVGGVEIAVFRSGGDYHAVANYCIHQGGPLCEGGLSGKVDASADGWEWGYDPEEYYVHCPWHGWLFDIRTGENPDAPGVRVPTYDVAVEDGDVFVLR